MVYDTFTGVSYFFYVQYDKKCDFDVTFVRVIRYKDKQLKQQRP